MTTATIKPPKKTWFPVGRGPHERELRHQLQGLRHVIDEVSVARKRGKQLTVLDAACAEGLIGLELLKAGACALHGVELVPERVRDANRLRGDLPATFERGDLMRWEPARSYDVVLALSILHKLPDPLAVARRLGLACSRMMVVRLPPPKEGDEGGVIRDIRSGLKPFDLRPTLAECHLNLEEETTGYLGEWIGFWRKKWPTT
jgi:trans-aconitate methyltransferase